MPTTWNPADNVANTLSGGNLTAAPSGNGGVRGTVSVSGGKYYWEYTATWGSSWACGGGVANAGAALGYGNSGQTGTITVAGGSIAGYVFVNTTDVGVHLGLTPYNGTVIGIALDATNQLIWFRPGPSAIWNNSGTANPATGTGGVSISTVAGPYYPFVGFNGITGGQSTTANFGDTALVGAVPSGFAAGFPGTAAAAAQAMAMVLA